MSWAPARGEGGSTRGVGRTRPRAALLNPLRTSPEFHAPPPRGVCRDGEQNRARVPSPPRSGLGRLPPASARTSRARALRPPPSSLLSSQVGSSVGPERGRARPLGPWLGPRTSPSSARRTTLTTGRCPAPRGYRGPWGIRSPRIRRSRTRRSCSASRACLRPIRLSSWPCCATSTSSTTWTASPWPVPTAGGTGEGAGPEGGAASRIPSRVSFPGVLPDIEQFFAIGDSSSGLIQTGEEGPSRGPAATFPFPTPVGPRGWRRRGPPRGRDGPMRP